MNNEEIRLLIARIKARHEIVLQSNYQDLYHLCRLEKDLSDCYGLSFEYTVSHETCSNESELYKDICWCEELYSYMKERKATGSYMIAEYISEKGDKSQVLWYLNKWYGLFGRNDIKRARDYVEQVLCYSENKYPNINISPIKAKWLYEWLDELEHNNTNKTDITTDELKTMPKELDNDEAKEVLQRAVDVGLLDNDYQPLKGTTQGQLKWMAIYASIELGIDEPWKVFGNLWGLKNLVRVKDEQCKQAKLNKVAGLFDESIVKRGKAKRFK